MQWVRYNHIKRANYSWQRRRWKDEDGTKPYYGLWASFWACGTIYFRIYVKLCIFYYYRVFISNCIFKMSSINLSLNYRWFSQCQKLTNIGEFWNILMPDLVDFLNCLNPKIFTKSGVNMFQKPPILVNFWHWLNPL